MEALKQHNRGLGFGRPKPLLVDSDFDLRLGGFDLAKNLPGLGV